MRRQELHENERPIAFSLWQNAEIHRDRKKKKQPYRIEDFYLYADAEKLDLPASRFGSAFRELIRLKLCPNWALFVYNDLMKADVGPIPEEIALISPYCIILAPSVTDSTVSGMLIALEEASSSITEFTSTSGGVVTLKVPPIKAKAYADEEAVLNILR